jgi:hypothetical protein
VAFLRISSWKNNRTALWQVNPDAGCSPAGVNLACVQSAAAASLLASTSNSDPETANSTMPQSMQSTSFGKTQTMASSRAFSQGKWMAISQLN